MSQERVVAIAADYADALLVARRAKRTIILLLVILLLAEIAIFAVAHFTNVLRPDAAAATTQASALRWPQLLHYASACAFYLAMIFSMLLVAVLFLTIHIMLVGRLIGVAYVTRAFTLSILLVLILFPWQSLLITQGLTTADPTVPGAIYSWREIREKVPMTGGAFEHQALYWARFAVFPLAALIMLLVVQVRSGRGLKLALGEEEILPPAADVTVVSR